MSRYPHGWPSDEAVAHVKAHYRAYLRTFMETGQLFDEEAREHDRFTDERARRDRAEIEWLRRRSRG